jgi:hypothetical protein
MMDMKNLTLQTPPQTTASASLTPAGITEPVVLRYFETLNEGAFQATGQLFSADGQMQPPFEQAVVAADSIAAYLQAEAKGFDLQPRQGVVQLLDDGCVEVQVVGKVQTPLFSVNVSWLFVLNAEKEIVLAKIKLLASPQELLSLR